MPATSFRQKDRGKSGKLQAAYKLQIKGLARKKVALVEAFLIIVSALANPVPDFVRATQQKQFDSAPIQRTGNCNDHRKFDSS